MSRWKSCIFIITEGPVCVNFNTCIGISSLLITLFIYIVPTSRESSSSVGRISKELIFSRHKYSTWRHHRIFPLSTKRSSCYFWYQRVQKLTRLFGVDQSNWTLRIIPNDFKIRFQVALSRNSRTSIKTQFSGKFWSGNYLQKKPPRSALEVHCRKFEAHCTVRGSGRRRLVTQRQFF